ncbi:hypothetical protein H0H87_001414 [Tephrocybe sp. NHM501043]|nr:hypothetical protein H0H87_001414 [Tephrocybe sp. NHM501043]
MVYAHLKRLGIGKVTWPLEAGKALSVAGKDIELDRPLTRSEYLSGQAFGSTSTAFDAPPVSLTKQSTKQFIPLKIPKHANHTSKPSTPLQPVDTVSLSDKIAKHIGDNAHWTANWRKPQQKKHQTWDGDAYISLIDRKLVMMSEDGKLMGSVPWKGDILCSGYRTMIGDKQVELDSQVKASQLPDLIEPSEASCGNNSVMEHNSPAPVIDTFVEQVARFVTPASFYGAPIKRKPKGPLHDPEAENAVVMKAPTKEHIKKFNKK